jgi:hypothetical protein
MSPWPRETAAFDGAAVSAPAVVPVVRVPWAPFEPVLVLTGAVVVPSGTVTEVTVVPSETTEVPPAVVETVTGTVIEVPPGPVMTVTDWVPPGTKMVSVIEGTVGEGLSPVPVE